MGLAGEGGGGGGGGGGGPWDLADATVGSLSASGGAGHENEVSLVTASDLVPARSGCFSAAPFLSRSFGEDFCFRIL